MSKDVAAAAQAMSTRPASVVATPAGPTLHAPLFTLARPDGNGVFVATLISVGGGPVIPVQIDTGSSGLVVDASAVGPQTQRFTDKPTEKQYLSHTVSGFMGSATVGIGPVTSAPVGLELADVPVGADLFVGTRGILGVASATAQQQNVTEPAPQLALPAPFDAGQSFAVARAGLGSWTLGPVSVPEGAQALPLSVASPEPGSPPAAPGRGQAYAKGVAMCWTVGTRPAICGPTDLDLGATDTAFNSTTDASLDAGGGRVSAGQPVTVSGTGGPPLWSFTSGNTPSADQVAVEGMGSFTRVNSGVAFYFGRTIAWDYPGGRLLVGPTTASAP